MFGRNPTQRRAPRNTATPEGREEVASQGFQGSPESGRAIRAQEHAGRQSFVESDTLPAKMNSAAKAALQKAGVRFGRPVPGDPLFVFVELPEGWKKTAASDHDMWSYLIDDKGTQRARIFYKAAFCDRRAELYVD